jgi:branched-subunit amino acid transport protein
VTAGTAWTVVALAAVVTAIIKAAGPLALGGRDLPEWTSGVIALLAPALLAALVVTAALTEGKTLEAGPETAGVAVAGVLYWRGASVVTGVLVAAAVTALLRLL